MKKIFFLFSLVFCLSLFSCRTSPPIPIVTHEYKLGKNGVDFTPALGCVGSIESKIANPVYDRMRRLVGYSYVVTCKNSKKSYTLKYSNIKYEGRKKTSYEEEMSSLSEHHLVVYKNIVYNEEGDTISYTALLDESERKYMK